MSPKAPAPGETSRPDPTARLLHALRALERGDLSIQLPADAPGTEGELATAFNALVERQRRLTEEYANMAAGVSSGGESLQAGSDENRENWRRWVDFVNTLVVKASEDDQRLRDADTVHQARELAEQLQLHQDELERSNALLEEKAEQLAITSRFKSEFMAKVSHELRTPLNSLLLLSEQLRNDPDGTMSKRQLHFAANIHEAGLDLLALINDILDLSKIEARAIDITPSEIVFEELTATITRSFSDLAQEYNLDFRVIVDEKLPSRFVSDGKRLGQILRNLLSNAFKFTDHGCVTLEISIEPSSPRKGDHETKNIRFSVIDTGCGIERDLHQVIFEAFQQGRTGAGKRAGGTGLGLKISRELARLIGGDISIESEPGIGSRFTLTLPLEWTPPKGGDRRSNLEAPQVPAASSGLDSADTLQALAKPHSATIMATEHDRPYLVIAGSDAEASDYLSELARGSGFDPVISASGGDALHNAHRGCTLAIVVNSPLPDMSTPVFIDRIKRDLETRHIPVLLIASEAEEARFCHRLGATDVLCAPARRENIERALADLAATVEGRSSTILLIHDDDDVKNTITTMLDRLRISYECSSRLGSKRLAQIDANAVIVATQDNVDWLKDSISRCVVSLENRVVPVIAYCQRGSSPVFDRTLLEFTSSRFTSEASSLAQLLDGISVAVHLGKNHLSEDQFETLAELQLSDPMLSGVATLIVDDDFRNIFALSSLLEQHNMDVHFAESGEECLERIGRHEVFDLILMDVMMPGMDGLETIAALRKLETCRRTPIIAITALAKTGERQRCIDAGADDYLAKPIDASTLVSLIRVQLALHSRPEKKRSRQ